MSNYGLLSTQRIELSLRDRMLSIRRASGHESASHAFTSLFLWQRDMDLSVCLRERAFAVRCGHIGDNVWFFPCGETGEVLRFVGDILDGFPKVHFMYLRREDAELLKEIFPGRFRIEMAEDSSEYLYDRADYEKLPGDKNRAIRWSINHLKSHHELRTEPLDNNTLDAARSIMEKWKPISSGEGYSPDRSTSSLMLENYEELDITGVVVYMDGRAAAVAVGFPLSKNSFDIAFSKAPDRETGLLHYARRMLVSRLPESYTVINGEEDLGIPGLRRAKRLEHPIGQIEMFEAYANQE